MNASSLWITPLFFNSVAMRRVEYPGRSSTKVCAKGVAGTHSAHAAHPAKANTMIRKSQEIVRTINSVDDVTQTECFPVYSCDSSRKNHQCRQPSIMKVPFKQGSCTLSAALYSNILEIIESFMRRSSPFGTFILLLAVLPSTACLLHTRPVEETYSRAPFERSLASAAD